MISQTLKHSVAAFALSCITLSSVLAAEQVSFTASSTYNGKKVVLTGELHKPDNPAKHPAVILMHGCGGLVPTVRSALRTHARVLTSNGFAALILDSFGPRNILGRWVCKTSNRLSTARAYRTKDAIDARKFLTSRPDIDPQNIFAMGQSNGGSVAVIIAQKGKTTGFRAVTAFYPWCAILSGSKSPTPLLILSGARDEWTSPERCQKLNNPAKGVTVKVYPNAVHSFDLDIPETTYQGHKVGGDAKATLDSRRQMVKFFKQHLLQ